MKKRMPLFPGMAGLTRGDILRLKAGGGDLLSVDLMLTQKCNFKCLYCYADGAPGKTQGLSMAEAKKLARQALRLGVKILNMQGGEPFMWRPADWKGGEEPLFHLMEHIKALYAADGLPVNLVSFTDAALITQARAQRLAALDVALCCKLDSLDEKIQDKLLDTPGGFKKIMAGLGHLAAAGYGKPELPPLSTNTVVTTLNYAGVPAVFRWSRRRGFKPFVIPVHVHGRAKAYSGLMLSGAARGGTLNPGDIKKLFTKLAALDGKEFGIRWKAESPWVENKACSRHLGGVHVRADGLVLPCSEAPEEWALGDIRKNSLKSIVSSSRVRIFRDIYSRLHEDCKCSARNCPLSAKGRCYGCRTRAYDESAFGGNGKYDPARLRPEAFFGGDPACWRKGR